MEKYIYLTKDFYITYMKNFLQINNKNSLIKRIDKRLELTTYRRKYTANR